MEWQPIETAPKGKRVLLSGINPNGIRWTVIARYIEKYTEEDYSDNEDADYCQEKDIYYWPEGWWEEGYEAEEIYQTSLELTHWMPLPNPPSQP